MLTLSRPINSWSWPLHALVVACALGIVAGVAWWSVWRSETASAAQQTQLKAAQRTVQSFGSARVNGLLSDYTRNLPDATIREIVARDIARFGQASNLQINTLSIQHQSASAREFGKTQFTVGAVADYASLKTWLAELLNRYSSLAVQAMSIRATPNDVVRLEVTLTLALFTKN